MQLTAALEEKLKVIDITLAGDWKDINHLAIMWGKLHKLMTELQPLASKWDNVKIELSKLGHMVEAAMRQCSNINALQKDIANIEFKMDKKFKEFDEKFVVPLDNDIVNVKELQDLLFGIE